LTTNQRGKRWILQHYKNVSIAKYIVNRNLVLALSDLKCNRWRARRLLKRVAEILT
jgi:hypothetical protein